MSGNAWVTRDDVLNDLREVNGRNTGAEYLEQYVVRGEAPPPVRQELTDDDELQYRFGGPGMSAGENFTPDLKGISLMLQMVEDLDPADSSESETKTIFRNKTTDEICISKLNPQVDEFVPGRRKTFKLEQKPEASKKVQLETLSKFDKRGPVLVRKSDKINISKGHINENGHRTKDNKELSNDITSTITTSTSNIRDEPNGKVAEESHSHSAISIHLPTKPALDKIEDISLDIKKMKCDEITQMKEKIKSKIISSSQQNSLQHRREKNVAIATLLKLCSAPRIPDDETSVKLVTPDYFQVPPNPVEVDDLKKSTSSDKDLDVSNKKIDQIPDTSSSANQKYVDPLVQESISKVNEWFNNTGSPKPKPQAFDPVKEPSVLKKKTTSSLSMSTTSKSEASSEKKGCGNFVPSTYANDLLQKYETNARKNNILPKEDLGTMLERQLKERDQLIKKKLLEKKNAIPQDSERSVN